MNTDPRKGWVRLSDVPAASYPPFVIDQLVHESCTVMYGRPKAGKSFLSLSLLSSLVTGEPWLGHKVRETRRPAFLALDPGQQGETKRRSMDIPGLDEVLLCTQRPHAGPEAWMRLGEELAAEGVDFLVIDNLTRLMPPGKSVRDDDAAAPVLDNIGSLERYGIGTLLVHHSGKPGEDGNPKTTPLGATAIEAWARHFLRVDAPRDSKTRRISRSVTSYGNEIFAEQDSEIVVPFTIEAGAPRQSQGDELRDWNRDAGLLTRIQERSDWKSQQQVADYLEVDKSTVSRLFTRNAARLINGRVVVGFGMADRHGEKAA